MCQVNAENFFEYVICVKRFTKYGHYAGEVKDIIIGRPQLSLKSLCQKLRAFIVAV